MSEKRHYINNLGWVFIVFVFLALVHFTLITPAAPADEVNYCTDDGSWNEWNDLVSKYPADEDIQILHALRLGLCAKVGRGDISVQQASDIFERVRSIILEKKKATTNKDKKV